MNEFVWFRSLSVLCMRFHISEPIWEVSVSRVSAAEELLFLCAPELSHWDPQLHWETEPTDLIYYSRRHHSLECCITWGALSLIGRLVMRRMALHCLSPDWLHSLLPLLPDRTPFVWTRVVCSLVPIGAVSAVITWFTHRYTRLHNPRHQDVDINST